MNFVLWFIFGCLFIEGAGAFWHKHVTHFGHLFFLDYYTRGRHAHHHYVSYPIKRLTSITYQKSCETTFHLLGILLIIVLLILCIYGFMLTSSALSFFFGSLVYGKLVLGYLHDLYHLDPESTRFTFLKKNSFLWETFSWLKKYHAIHHYQNKNFAIGLPVFDILMRSFSHPRNLEKITSHKLTENLFPRFSVKKISRCNEKTSHTSD
jgi:hypothetical protein